MGNNDKLKVGILGATGAVGQRFVERLQGHPWFNITAVAASERSAGKRYAEAVNWTLEGDLPPDVADLEVSVAGDPLECDLVFSGLDASVAGNIEANLAAAGIPVVSNARNHRMRPDVPLLIPEVNPDHLSVITRQPTFNNGGFIVTNPNCSTIGLVTALKPVHEAFGIKTVQVTTLQALSGAGYPGVPSVDALGNVIPFIGGEEEKMETETLKLLGTVGETGIQPAGITVSAQCNRVPVIDGHLECVSVTTAAKPGLEEFRRAFSSFVSPTKSLGLPSEPEEVIRVFDQAAFPQPRRHAGLGDGMTVSVGRIRPCHVADFRFVVLSHNTVRGAAGGAILNAELLVKKGYIGGH